MLAAEQESTEVEVTWEDQQRINRFGALTTRKAEVESLLRLKREELLKIDDASTDVQTEYDDEDIVKYRVGGVFVEITAESAVAKLEAAEERCNTEIAAYDAEIARIKDTLAELKVVLVSKFKDSINLEETPRA